MKTCITEQERLQLLGLLTLAAQHYRIVNQAEEAMAKILMHDDSYVDQLSDAIYQDNLKIDDILTDMGIGVAVDANG